MKLRCKAGDLALVVHDEHICQQNIGKLVRVAGPVQINRRFQKMCWLIEPVKPELWECVTGLNHHQAVVTFSSNIEHPDDWLLPIQINNEELGQSSALIQCLPVRKSLSMFGTFTSTEVVN